MVLPEFMQDLIPLILALLVGVGIWSLLSLFLPFLIILLLVFFVF